MSNLQTFRQYNSAEEAAAIVARLEAAGIQGLLSDNQPAFDASFAYNTTQRLYTLSLSPSDAQRAESLLTQWAEAEAEQVDSDHYLLTFTVDELYDVLRHPAEWDLLDVKIATRLLRERGHKVTEKDLRDLEAQEAAKMAAPDPVERIWMINGYLFALMGGPFGILIGYVIRNGQKSLPDGRKVWLHSEKDRRHGKNMMVIGICMFVVVVVITSFVL
jgi:hypothetical protein